MVSIYSAHPVRPYCGVLGQCRWHDNKKETKKVKTVLFQVMWTTMAMSIPCRYKFLDTWLQVEILGLILQTHWVQTKSLFWPLCRLHTDGCSSVRPVRAGPVLHLWWAPGHPPQADTAVGPPPLPPGHPVSRVNSRKEDLYWKYPSLPDISILSWFVILCLMRC